MAPGRFDSSDSRGFSLVEVVIAMGLLTVVSLGVAQLFAASTYANLVAHGQTSTVAMASQKMEQIRSLTWGFDLEGQGLPVSDTTTNLAAYPHTSDGTGLNPTPSNALDENVSGCVDYLDVNGSWVGTGLTPPPGAAYVRRWSIVPLPTNPNNTLVIRVMVAPLATEMRRSADSPARRRLPGETLLTSVKTRKAS